MDLNTFRQSLDQDRMYKVENSTNYNHVLPKDMTIADLSELQQRKMNRGDSALLEGSIMYRSVLLG